MKHAVRAVIAVALGAGLAAAAQAQVTNTQSTMPSPNSTMQSAAPSSTIQSTSPTGTLQNAAPQKQRLQASVQKRGQKNIRQVQLRLKSKGLYRGRIDGIMGPGTRLALARSKHENGLQRTATLKRPGSSMQKTRIAHATTRAPKAQTTGVGSSMPNTTSTPMAPSSTNPAPAAAGGTGSTAPSTPSATTGPTGTTQPITGTTKK